MNIYCALLQFVATHRYVLLLFIIFKLSTHHAHTFQPPCTNLRSFQVLLWCHVFGKKKVYMMTQQCTNILYGALRAKGEKQKTKSCLLMWIKMTFNGYSGVVENWRDDSLRGGEQKQMNKERERKREHERATNKWPRRIVMVNDGGTNKFRHIEVPSQWRCHRKARSVGTE